MVKALRRAKRELKARFGKLESEGLVLIRGDNVALTDAGFDRGFKKLFGLYQKRAGLSDDDVTEEVFDRIISIMIEQGIVARNGGDLSPTEMGQQVFLRDLLRM